MIAVIPLSKRPSDEACIVRTHIQNMTAARTIPATNRTAAPMNGLAVAFAGLW